MDLSPENSRIRNLSVFFRIRIKLQAEACNFIKKETLNQMFSYEFCEIFKKSFLQSTFGGYLRIHPICEIFSLEELSQDAGKLLEGMHAGTSL